MITEFEIQLGDFFYPVYILLNQNSLSFRTRMS